MRRNSLYRFGSTVLIAVVGGVLVAAWPAGVAQADDCHAVREVRLLARRHGLDGPRFVRLEQLYCSQRGRTSACSSLTIMEALARMVNASSEGGNQDSLLAARTFVCDGRGRLERWANGRQAVSLSGVLYYPSGREARSSTGNWYYPDGQRARSTSGVWFYPNGARARTDNGVWYTPGGDRMGRRAEVCRVLGLRRQCEVATAAADQVVATLELAWLAYPRRTAQ